METELLIFAAVVLAIALFPKWFGIKKKPKKTYIPMGG